MCPLLVGRSRSPGAPACWGLAGAAPGGSWVQKLCVYPLPLGAGTAFTLIRDCIWDLLVPVPGWSLHIFNGFLCMLCALQGRFVIHQRAVWKRRDKWQQTTEQAHDLQHFLFPQGWLKTAPNNCLKTLVWLLRDDSVQTHGLQLFKDLHIFRQLSGEFFSWLCGRDEKLKGGGQAGIIQCLKPSKSFSIEQAFS